MTNLTGARIEIIMFSVIAFGAGQLWPSWEGIALVAFLVWAGLTMVKDEWDEQRADHNRREK